MASLPGYSFPSISIPEIVSVVREWGMQDVQQAQLAHCDSQTIQQIYAVALQRATGITLDALDVVTESLVSGLDEHGVRRVNDASQLSNTCFLYKGDLHWRYIP